MTLIFLHYLFLKSCSLVSVSLSFSIACDSLSDNISLSFKHLSNTTNELLPMVLSVLSGNFVPKQTHMSSKSFVSNLLFYILTKSNRHLVCNSAMSFCLSAFPSLHYLPNVFVGQNVIFVKIC